MIIVVVVTNGKQFFMPIFDIFSKRQQRLRGEVPDIYQYKELPQQLRVKIFYIVKSALGEAKSPNMYGAENASMKVYRNIRDALRLEYGVFQLGQTQSPNAYTPDIEVFDFFLNCSEIEKCLDFVELCFLAINNVGRDNSYLFTMKSAISITPDQAIEELNARFHEHGVGYQFESGEIIRVDSKLLHNEVVMQVLQLLSNPLYSGANAEFLKAHEHYRHGRYAECLNECLKAFESTMKIIGTKRKWENLSPTLNASGLIQLCLNNNLIPSYLQTQFTALRTILESGIPTVRNKQSGHGQGTNPVKIPEHFASYMLHMTATTILFLVDLEKA